MSVAGVTADLIRAWRDVSFDPDIGHHLLIIRTFCDGRLPSQMWFHGIDRWLPGFLRGDSLISHAWTACFVHFALQREK